MIEQAVTSFFDGRVRLRHPLLRQPGLEAQLQERIGPLPGIRSLNINPRSGSLLLEYDPQQIRKEDLLEMADLWLLSQEHTAHITAEKRSASINTKQMLRFVQRSLPVTLGLSSLLGFLGKKQAHVATGALFIACALIHMYQYRKCL